MRSEVVCLGWPDGSSSLLGPYIYLGQADDRLVVFAPNRAWSEVRVIRIPAGNVVALQLRFDIDQSEAVATGRAECMRFEKTVEGPNEQAPGSGSKLATVGPDPARPGN